MNLRPIPNPDAACDGRGRVERRYAIRQPRRMAIENPERLRMPRREWDDQENSK
jgi:hypothetical protein